MKKRTETVLIALTAIVLVTLLALSGCGGSSGESRTVPLPPPHGDEQEVRRANLNYAWPFRVDHGTIACHSVRGKPLLLFTDPDGRSYALNGVAEEHGYPEVDPVRNGFSLGVIIGDAFKLCVSNQ